MKTALNHIAEVVARAPAVVPRFEDFGDNHLVSKFIKECIKLGDSSKSNTKFEIECVGEGQRKTHIGTEDKYWEWQATVNGHVISFEFSGSIDHCACSFKPAYALRVDDDHESIEEAHAGVFIEDHEIKFRWSSQKSEIADLFAAALSRPFRQPRGRQARP